MNSNQENEWAKQLKLFVGVSTLLTSYSIGGVGVGYLGFIYLGLPKILSVVTGVFGLTLGILKIMQWVNKNQ
ncbi:MAG: hypothetical protein KA715_01850 [Xanthomonadaceae bacterium]|nr:hypothetical protein [Xanthomonadaceae bacterium]